MKNVAKLLSYCVFSAGAVAVTLIPAARAADVSIENSAEPVPPGSSATNWSGFYLGGSIGYATHFARYEDRDLDWYESTHEYYSQGFTYGLQAGRNWQKNALVYGIEADITGLTNNRDVIFASDNLVNNQVKWMASLRARAGLGIGNTFLYYTGGLAYAKFERSWLEAGDPDDSWPDLGAAKLGVIGGIGIERQLGNNWSARVEAKLAYFGDNTTINVDGFSLIIDDNIATINFGLNYRFGDGLGASAPYVYGTPHDFSGSYVGLAIGGHLADIGITDINFENYGSTYENISTGLSGGAQIGHNWQNGAQLFGVEAAFNLHGGDENFTGDFGSFSIESGVNWSGEFKVKSGVVAGDTLMYLLAGLSYTDYDAIFDGGDRADVGGSHIGYIAGVGIEQALGANLTARLEATYSGIGNFVELDSGGDGPFRGDATNLAVMAGLNYYFNGSEQAAGGVLAPTADWSGAFAGLDVKFAHHTGSIFDRVYDDHGGSYVLPSFGVGGGANIGYNWQDESFVYGVIADIAMFTNETDDVANNFRQMSSKLNWMGTVRGRAGIATGNSLFYVTGGLAIADADLELRYLPQPNPNDFDLSGIRTGWVAGVGVEHKLTERSSVKLETLYASFGESSAQNGDTCSNALVTEPCEMMGYDSNVTVNVSYVVKIGG